ncbi:ATP nucleotide 3'-pyrophosphokinase [Streptomyces sp. 549]|uniref:ATP nucleotide 3'-pyrophosphokinase n=1 Tax=Streptomyces sp. 549 TaxID=3049076 RepID=UPI0024C23B0B|nr:ATP nucleotide 3'-pyrophosphokinase [Streptomyces sp. 549]MDK1474990.1 ATP nucleotide 3'-pyrophosphokinase [Streptomyces sp. 549]
MTFNRLPARALTGAAFALVLGAAPAQGAAALAGPELPLPVEEPQFHQPPGGGGWEKGGLRLDAEDNRAVDAFLDEAEQAEKHLSPQLRTVASWSGAELVGFDQRLKTPDSLKRKVATWLEEDPSQSVHQALGDINDSVRYTLRWSDGEYTEGVRTASVMLADFGHESVRWSNTWKNRDSYKAVNSAWREPMAGHRFEVQFHTEAGHRAAVETHPLYEEQRLPGTSPERVAELREQQGRIFAAVPVPDGAERLTAPRSRPAVPAPAPLPAPVPARAG